MVDRMKNVVQVVETMPTPDGQWVTFWHVDGGCRVSGEFLTDANVVTFDHGDVYACLDVNAAALDLVGPLSPDLFSGDAFRLPVTIAQTRSARHADLRRFVVDREDATISEEASGPVLPNDDLSEAEQIETITNLREMHH